MHETAPADETQRYQLGEVIGRGGLGSVHRAWDGRLERWVAIKRLALDPTLGADEVEAKMRREANALAALQHPNVVTVHDFGADEEGPYVVMELIEGQTLDALVESAPFDYESFLELAGQTLSGVAAAHRAGLLHRDLKPGNVMLAAAPSSPFQVKVLDFGLAKFAPTPLAQTLDQSDSLFGSIYFMAPEQFRREALDARTDLYALGCVFYYTLTCRHPFIGDNVATIMASHLQHHVRDLASLRLDVPEPIAEWVMRLLSLHPTDRPAGAAEALTILRALTRTAALPAAPDVSAAPAAPADLGRKLVPLVLASVILAVIGFAGLHFLRAGGKVLPPAAAAVSFGHSSVGPKAGLAPAPSATPAARPLVVATASPTPTPGSVALPASVAPAVPAATPLAAAPPPLPAPPATPAPALLANDLPTLRAQLGQFVEVRGIPVATGRAKSGTVCFLNFSPRAHDGLSLVFFLNGAGSVVRGVEDLQPYVGRAVSVHGQLSDFKGDVQIVVKSLDQIRPDKLD